jgi:hypothetical protein
MTIITIKPHVVINRFDPKIRLSINYLSSFPTSRGSIKKGNFRRFRSILRIERSDPVKKLHVFGCGLNKFIIFEDITLSLSRDYCFSETFEVTSISSSLGTLTVFIRAFQPFRAIVAVRAMTVSDRLRTIMLVLRRGS